MLLALLSLLVIASAAPTYPREEEFNPLLAEIENLTDILAENKINESVIEDFINLNINGLPFTTKIYEVYRNWTKKWEINIPGFEEEVGAVLVNTLNREVASRTAEFFSTLGEWSAPMSEFAQTGVWSDEAYDALAKINASASPFQRDIVDRVKDHMLFLIEGDGGHEQTNEKAPEVEETEAPGPDGEVTTDETPVEEET
ncbi:hypothetical protein PMAYCL1PPCAC_07979, partial [Pristionchus mayeri]